VKDGKVESAQREQIELALGWGAFGKKILIVSEDAKTGLLRKLVSQWPSIERMVAFYPGTGYQSLPTPEQAKEIHSALGGKFKILVHRDKDSLTDDEANEMQQKFEAHGAKLWLPDVSDVEAYFCTPPFISELSSCPLADANSIIQSLLDKNQAPIRDQFAKQRKKHNDDYHAAGGSPDNADVWEALQQSSFLRGAKGKYIYNQLKNAIPGKKFSDASVLMHKLQHELAENLRLCLTDMLEANE
jgi:hypothetical protein